MKKNSIEGVVVKVTQSYCVLLCDDGTFKNVPRNKKEVPKLGERLTYDQKPQFTLFQLKYISAMSMAAILFISLVTYGFIQKSSEPYYVVAIDINPSIELYLNKDLKVLTLSPLNEDGKKIVDLLEIEDADLYTMTEKIVTVSKRYFHQHDKGLISTTIVNLKDLTTIHFENNLKETIENQLHNHQVIAEVKVFNETKEYYDQAQYMNVSVNKYRLYETLNDKGIVSGIKDIKEKSLWQLENMLVEESIPEGDESSIIKSGDTLDTDYEHVEPLTPLSPKNMKENIERSHENKQSQQKGSSDLQKNSKVSIPTSEASKNDNSNENVKREVEHRPANRPETKEPGQDNKATKP
ncbi:hypothetical protein BKP45_07105 [Anaerobacillus alkalidiazotrophicus]|uniref:RsgI N-terminal anti-sigma domain-containing protein n=1 Tax=Anaerobacillus alkalidiazotrophicus TaxID=472963 RepID=A0A1S2MEW1_9BACI|nr:hypothetical protein [Anaerobacillus alkalidiazotrophicus]OIJ22397.1 hypothetical protein BKP45_07105 [Anaerobacillus alkalidiazotrophicus]